MALIRMVSNPSMHNDKHELLHHSTGTRSTRKYLYLNYPSSVWSTRICTDVLVSASTALWTHLTPGPRPSKVIQVQAVNSESLGRVSKGNTDKNEVFA